jgi:hypothetical protein
MELPIMYDRAKISIRGLCAYAPSKLVSEELKHFDFVEIEGEEDILGWWQTEKLEKLELLLKYFLESYKLSMHFSRVEIDDTNKYLPTSELIDRISEYSMRRLD